MRAVNFMVRIMNSINELADVPIDLVCISKYQRPLLGTERRSKGRFFWQTPLLHGLLQSPSLQFSFLHGTWKTFLSESTHLTSRMTYGEPASLFLEKSYNNDPDLQRY